MAFRDLLLQKVYDTRKPGDDPVANFYIPVLSESVAYDRGTGYFSSTVLALAARGVAGFIRNGGRMRILTSPELTAEDAKVLLSMTSSVEVQTFVEERLAAALGEFEMITTILERDHLRALAWMLTEGTLEIRIVVPRSKEILGGMLHFKIGLMTDSRGDVLSFSGSNNESVGGWVRNIEQIHVFKSWEPQQEEYLRGNQEIFDRYWSTSDDVDTITIPLPRAIRENLIKVAPSDTSELEEILNRIDQNKPKLGNLRKLRGYQELAVAAWRDNNCRGILEMATGTGKTLTATKCIDEVLSQEKRSVVLIVAPQIFLANQWAKELGHLDPLMVYGGTNWRDELRSFANDLKLGLVESVIMIAVQNTASTEEFIRIAGPLIDASEISLIVADEVHGVGADQFSRLMLENFECRLGLSATPNRWHDEDGTALITRYFGGVVYSFGIHEALNWIDPESGQTPLCPYRYFPMFVELTDSEEEKYRVLSDKIKRAFGGGESPMSDYLKRLQMERARLVKRAENKIPTLKQILETFEDFSGTLIYCSDFEQLTEAALVLDGLDILYRRFTGEEGALASKAFGGKSERDGIMADFESGTIDVLLAMKCLDEGVDIPSARRGIILASSTNPREFIQRRGRLLRRAPGKTISDIYDVLVVPNPGSGVDAVELNLLKKELDRVEEFARDAQNEIEIQQKIMEMTWKILR
jgi:superfamily II DNA or RNA helicase